MSSTDVSNVTGIIPPILGLAVAGSAIKLTRDALRDSQHPTKRRAPRKDSHHNKMHEYFWG